MPIGRSPGCKCCPGSCACGKAVWHWNATNSEWDLFDPQCTGDCIPLEPSGDGNEDGQEVTTCCIPGACQCGTSLWEWKVPEFTLKFTIRTPEDCPSIGINCTGPQWSSSDGGYELLRGGQFPSVYEHLYKDGSRQLDATAGYYDFILLYLYEDGSEIEQPARIQATVDENNGWEVVCFSLDAVGGNPVRQEWRVSGPFGDDIGTKTTFGSCGTLCTPTQVPIYVDYEVCGTSWAACGPPAPGWYLLEDNCEFGSGCVPFPPLFDGNFEGDERETCCEPYLLPGITRITIDGLLPCPPDGTGQQQHDCNGFDLSELNGEYTAQRQGVSDVITDYYPDVTQYRDDGSDIITSNRWRIRVENSTTRWYYSLAYSENGTGWCTIAEAEGIQERAENSFTWLPADPMSPCREPCGVTTFECGDLGDVSMNVLIEANLTTP